MRVATIVLLLGALSARAELEWRGFSEYALAAQTRGDGVLPLHEARVQLAGDLFGERSELHFAADLLADRMLEEERVELREAFARLDLFGRAAELRVGRQPMTWGTGDLIFLHDVFPKDYESFFGGRDDVYLKLPVDGARLSVFAGSNTLDLVFIPRLTADRLPSAERFGLGQLALPPIAAIDNELDEAAWAARLARPFGNWSAAAYGAYGRSGQPLGQRDGMLWHPKRALYGASLRGTLRGGVAWLEGGREQLEAEPRAALPGDQWSAFGGYEHALWGDATLNGQLQWSEREAQRRQWLWTSRFEQLLMSQTLRLSLFVFHGASADDGLVRVSCAYDLEDGLRLTLGGHLFHGEPDGSFGRMDDADAVYFRVRRMF